MKKLFRRRIIRHSDRLFHKHFLLLVSSATAVLIFAATLLYANFEAIGQRIVFLNVMKSLGQTQYDTSVLVETGQNLTLQVYADKSCQPLLHYTTPSSSDTAMALNQLGNYQFMKFVESIYIYNARSGQVYLSNAQNRYHNFVVPINEFFDKEIIEWIHSYETRPAYTAFPRTITLANGVDHPVYSFFGYNFQDIGPNGELTCAVVVNISTRWIGGVLTSATENYSEGMGGETFLLDSDGRVVSDSEAYPMHLDLSQEEYIQSILGTDKNGYYVWKDGLKKTFLAYSAPDQMGWRYICAIPYDLIVQDIVAMRRHTIWLVLLLGLGTVIIFYVVNSILYRPIEKYRQDLLALQAENRAAAYGAKQSFLRQLLLERGEGRQRETLVQLFKMYDISFPPEGEFFVAIVKIDHYEEFRKKWTEQERSSLRYGILNIARDIFSPVSTCEGIDMGWGNLVVLLHSDMPGMPSQDKFSICARSFQDAVKKHLDLSISLFLSQRGGVADIDRLYSQAMKTVRYRIFSGVGCLLYASEEQPTLPQGWLYPEKKERTLTEALLKGNLEQSQAVYLEIVNDCIEGAREQFESTISRLILSLNQLMAVLQKRRNVTPLPCSSLVIDLENVESLEEIHQCFFEFMQQITSFTVDEKKGRVTYLVESINDVISLQYADPDLCIEHIAHTMGLSGSYMGRIYKQETGISIVEKIQAVRMNHACRLLRDTDEPVSNIAQAVGYNNDTYFYKVFHHENGVTPVNYRKEHQGTSISGKED